MARYGIPVRIIDTLPEPATSSRGFALQPRTLELFERMDVVERFLDEGVRYREVFVRSARKLIVHESLSGIRSRYNYLLAVPQNRIEAILTRALRALGVEIDRSTHLVHIEQGSNAVRVHLRGPEGETSTDYSYLVGCDGAHSTVRHLLDVKFIGESVSESFAIADVRLEGDFPHDAISIFLSQNNIAAVFPLPRERWRVIVERKGGFPEEPTIEDIRTSLHAGGADVVSCSDPTWVARHAINQRRVSGIAHWRVFLAGDAAYVHSPIGAQGMNTGIQDAENLAWKIALTLRNEALDPVLESYAPERETVAATLLRTAGSFSRLVAQRHPNVRLVRDRTAALATSVPMMSDKFRDAVTELQVVYDRSKIVVTQGRTPDPRPGAHAPDGVLVPVNGGERTTIFKLISTLRHVLLVFTFRYDQWVHEARTVAEKYPGIVDAYVIGRDPSVAGAMLVDVPGTVFRAYGMVGEPQYVLIRPDGYVALRGAARDIGFLGEYMAKNFIVPPA